MAVTKIADLDVRASLDGTEEIPTVKTGDTTGKTVTVQQVADYATALATSFLALSDTPNAYTGQSLKQVRVNVGETALEFSTASAADVVGPASSGDGKVVLFDGITGKLIKDSGLTLTGTNTGDQTSMSGISDTKANFNTACSDGNFLFTGDISGGDATNNIGYLNIPQNSQSAAYTTVLSDSGKHILHPASDNNPRTFTINSNANVAYPVGTAITFINMINTVTIAITSDTMTLMGAGTTGSRTLAANGMATAIKIGTTSWIISGNGLT